MIPGFTWQVSPESSRSWSDSAAAWMPARRTRSAVALEQEMRARVVGFTSGGLERSTVQERTARERGAGHNGVMGTICSTAVVVIVLTVLFPHMGGTQTLPTARDGVTPNFAIHVFGDTFADFTARIERYFELRGRLERDLPPVTITDDVRQLRRGTRSLASAIRGARRGAVQGEFFTAETSAEFRQVLAPLVNANVWALIMTDNPGAFRHDIDGPYPEGAPHAMVPANILAQLPRLPDDILFRFVGPHLILYDMRANTIIDELPNAIECTNACDKQLRHTSR